MKRRIRLLLACVLMSSAAAGCKRVQEEVAAAQNPYPSSSPLHAPFDRMLRKLARDPRYVDAMRAAGSPEAAQRKGFELSMGGLQRLDDAALQKRLGLLATILEASDESTCALLARPDPGDTKATTDAVIGSLKTLPVAQIDAWFDFSLQATSASLGNAPVRTADPAATQAAMQMLVQRLPGPEQARMTETMRNLRQAATNDVCWAGRTLYRQALQLPEPQRSTLARAFASPG